MSIKKKGNSTLIIAHRGGGGLGPENTLECIKEGLKYRADMIEIDIHQTKDEILIAIHDKSIDRTTNGKGLVKELTFKQILQYNSVSDLDKDYTNITIPSLEQILELVKMKSKLLIELKKGNNYYLNIEERLIELIKKHKAEDRCIIQSFDINILKRIHLLSKNLELHFLCFGKLPFMPAWIGKKILIDPFRKYDFIKGINIHYFFANTHTIYAAHQRNRKVLIWTVDNEKKMRKLLNLGVDGIITNYPNYLFRIMNKC